MRRMLIGALLVASVGRAALGQVKSQAYTWKNVKITAGGFITGIVFSPAEAGLAYCRTDIGGAYRWDGTLKQWVCLTDWIGPQNLNLGGCESVAADPENADKVYVALGTYAGGDAAIARSADRGKTWAVTRVPLAMGANEDGRGMGERLAVDPKDARVLYFGSRSAGLWRSGDGAATWARVDGWPAGVGGANAVRGAPGLPWVVFDTTREDHKGTVTKSIFVGAAAGGESSVYHSADGGETWAAVDGAPPMMPHRAALDTASRTLYISYGNGPGPNNVTAGTVAKYEIDTHKWTNITPTNPGNGGYGGLALDPKQPGTLMVATIDHWSSADAIFRSTDGGATWKSINATADRDGTGVPYLANLLRGHAFDWWLAALAIDPFDSNHVMYGTGAGIWGTHNMTAFDAGRGTRWNPEAEGIEETAVLALASPPWGEAHLISGVGDIGGFTHVDLTVSPPVHTNPMFSNTISIAFADLKPVVVRTGTASRGGGTVACSEDGGKTWRTLALPGGGPAAAGRGGAYLTVSADGTTLLCAAGGAVSISKDLGVTWTPSTGLFNGARPIADRVAPATFYALDTNRSRIYISTDGGATFSDRPALGISGTALQGTGRGAVGGARVLKASFEKEGVLWLSGGSMLYRSDDGGLNFTPVRSGLSISNFALGKAAPGHENPAIFAFSNGRGGTIDPNGSTGLFRSDDDGATWIHINDDHHQFGGNLTVMTGDPRVYGRFYLGMNGRGILCGDPR